jgi:hypothetical protein
MKGEDRALTNEQLDLKTQKCYNFALLYIIFSSFPTPLHNFP